MEKLPTPKEKARKLPHKSGVYIMKDSLGSIIYIGKAADLKKRVGQYFMASYKTRASNPKIASLADSIADFDFVITRSEAEAIILESNLIKQWKPRYNTLSKDNKNFLHLRVETFSAMPRFAFARHRKEDNSTYFGPYIGSSALRSALNEIKKQFGILLSDAHPKKLPDGKWMLYSDARKEISNFENIVTQGEYLARVNAAIDFLKRKDGEALADAEKKMQEASDAMEYEKAAKFRDLISAIWETQKAWNVSADISRSSPEIAMLALESLQKTLSLKKDPRSIECFDISHISGSFCVASMVRFEDGEPAKQKYRRFKIKSFIGNDDFRAMKEAVSRRYTRLNEEGVSLPDLILIDGGKGQVFSAMKAFDEAKIRPPKIVGLAKREETIVTDFFEEKKLSRRHEGLKLLQRVRDEAHRFANAYSEALRSRKIRESILDDLPGLGRKRKDAVIAHFGSIAKVKNATIDELRQVDGIGFETAVQIREFLDSNFPSQKDSDEQ